MSVTTPLKIIFMGTPHFAVPALGSLCASDHKVIAVYSQPPRPKGRGQKIQASPVHSYAESQGLPVYTPENFKDPATRAEFASFGADIAVVAAYGLILPEEVLNAPKYGCINIHASLLPRWRGASPIQHAIWKGDSDTGITIMQMEKGLDTGPMLARMRMPITPGTTVEDLHDMLADLGAAMLEPVFANIETLEGEPQNDALTTYAPMLTKQDGKIDWAGAAATIDRQIRALNPWPGTWCMNGDKRLKILSATLLEEDSGTEQPGMVLDGRGRIACGEGMLKLGSVQPDGGKPMSFSAALNGGHLNICDILT